MFDSMIEPILLYGSELWGYEHLKVIEQIESLLLDIDLCLHNKKDTKII
jgi:hypothetical protein